MNVGHRVWVFPDGYLPPKAPYDPSQAREGVEGHEALMVLNTGDVSATVTLQVYFEDTDPWTIRLPELPARRVRSYRLDERLGEGVERISEGRQYSLVVESDHPVVAQFGRMDIRQPNLAYYTVMGFPIVSAPL